MSSVSDQTLALMRRMPTERVSVLVVGDQVVATNKGETASITGDGVHTVQQLI